jgi:hypothetical protein
MKNRSFFVSLVLIISLGSMAIASFDPSTPAVPEEKSESKDQIDLKDHLNVKLDNIFPSERFPNNNLKALKTGMQKLGDVTYDIGNGALLLGSDGSKGKPEKIEGIKVGRMADKLHFLHGTGNMDLGGTVIGKYVIRYADKTTTDIEIVYGKHVVDWWAYPCLPAPTLSKAVWEGENEAAKQFNAKIKLYHMEWDNPHPDKAIATIDFVVTDINQMCAPFCVAITAEATKDTSKSSKADK